MIVRLSHGRNGSLKVLCRHISERGPSDSLVTPEANAITDALLPEPENAGIDIEAIREDAARETQEGSDDEHHQAVQAAIRRVLPAPAEDAARSEAGGRESSGQDNGEPAGDQGQEGLTLAVQDGESLHQAPMLRSMDGKMVYLSPEQLQEQNLPPLTLCGGPVAPYWVAFAHPVSQVTSQALPATTPERPAMKHQKPSESPSAAHKAAAGPAKRNASTPSKKAWGA